MDGGTLYVVMISLIGFAVGTVAIYKSASEYFRLEFRVKEVGNCDQYYPQVKLKKSFNWVTIVDEGEGFILKHAETIENSRSTFRSAEDFCRSYKQELMFDNEVSEKITIVCED